jgi:hypothetical protein
MPINKCTVIETINGKQQDAIIMDDIELNQRIDYLAKHFNNNNYTLTTQKSGWYRVDYGDKQSFLRYKMLK